LSGWAADVPITLARELERLRAASQKLAHPEWGEYRSDEAIVRAALKEHMSEKEGILRMMASGQWAVYRPGRVPVEITSGEMFRIEIAGAKDLQLTRMEFDQIDRQYYSIDDYLLRDGLRATIVERD